MNPPPPFPATQCPYCSTIMILVGSDGHSMEWQCPACKTIKFRPIHSSEVQHVAGTGAPVKEACS
jgi:hypothetical protein